MKKISIGGKIRSSKAIIDRKVDKHFFFSCKLTFLVSISLHMILYLFSILFPSFLQNEIIHSTEIFPRVVSCCFKDSKLCSLQALFYPLEMKKQRNPLREWLYINRKTRSTIITSFRHFSQNTICIALPPCRCGN